MSSPGLRILNTLALFLVLLVSLGIQSTLWPQIFGSIPSPQLWLIVIVYAIVYRPPRFSLFLIYGLGLGVLSTTATSMGMLFLNLLILYSLVSLFKSRFYWGGVGYFTLMCFIASLSFHLIYLLASGLVEVHMAEVLFWQRAAQILFTPFAAVIFYPILKKLDQWTFSEEILIETGGPDL